jgi:cystathionine gamma-lyase
MCDENSFKLRFCESEIVSSTIFKLNIPGEYSEKYHYSRYGNPTRDSLESSLASLDRGKFCVTFSSRTAASLAILSVLKTDDLVIFSDFLTFEKFKTLKSNCKYKFVDFSDMKSFKSSLKENTKIVWIETPSLLLLKVFDIKSIAEIIHAKSKALLVVDNTLLTSRFQLPLKLGADFVLYSIGEFVSGHSDVMMGAVVTDDEKIYEKLKYFQYSSGAIPSPFDCFLVSRSLKTLSLRMEKHSKNSFAVAKFLSAHPKVEKVFHPSLEINEIKHEIGSKQSNGHPGVVSFIIKGKLEESKKFLKYLKSILNCESFGGTESSFIWSHSNLSEKKRIDLGMAENLMRISIGLEDAEEIIRDFNQALKEI